MTTARAPSGVARRAVGLAAAAAGAIAITAAIFGLAYAIGGSGGTEDNWVGFLVGIVLPIALLASLVAFVLAVVATARREHWTFLWLPLSLFPATLAFLVLGEAFWWE